MSNFNSLANYFLLATPKLNKSYFNKAVILLCEHNEYGAVGLIINKTLDVSIFEIMANIQITQINPSNNTLKTCNALTGGPMQPEQGFVIHRKIKQQWQSSLNLTNNLSVTTSIDILKYISHTDPTKTDGNFLFVLGYSGWGPGQLEQELAEDSWLLYPIDTDIIFNTPIDKKWDYAIKKLGITDISQYSNLSGHA